MVSAGVGEAWQFRMLLHYKMFYNVSHKTSLSFRRLKLAPSMLNGIIEPDQNFSHTTAITPEKFESETPLKVCDHTSAGATLKLSASHPLVQRSGGLKIAPFTHTLPPTQTSAQGVAYSHKHLKY